MGGDAKHVEVILRGPQAMTMESLKEHPSH
jgi:hypothetical protein